MRARKDASIGFFVNVEGDWPDMGATGDIALPATEKAQSMANSDNFRNASSF